MNAPSCLGGESWVQAQSISKDLYVLLLSGRLRGDSEERTRKMQSRAVVGALAWLGLTVWAGGQLT